MTATPPPQTLILNYVTRGFAVPRARVIAWVSLLVVGVAYLAVGLGLASWLERDIMAELSFGWAPHSPASWGDVIEALESDARFWSSLMLIPLGIATLPTALFVRAGKRLACRMGAFLMGPLVVALIGGSALTFSLAVVEIRCAHPSNALIITCFALSLPTLFLALLALDVISFLNWVAIAPIEEMPKKKFIG